MRPLEQIVERLQRALGAELVSVILYGSAAAGDRDEKFSDYNVLCVLRQVTPAQLRASEPVFRWWREQGNPAPLLLTEQEVRTCTDCFAMEFHDICEHHRILYGEDVIAGLTIDDSFYRAQVEHDLRARFLRLRQKASGILSDDEVLGRLLADSVSTFCVLLRHALRLYGFEVPCRKREIISRAQQEFGIDPEPFLTLLKLREGHAHPREAGSEKLLAAYMKEISTVIERVDVLEK